MDSQIESMIKLTSENLNEKVLQNCLKNNYFFAPMTLIGKLNRDIIILIDFTKEMPKTFKEIETYCIKIYEKIANTEPINNYIH